jgi:hypothetical protein
MKVPIPAPIAAGNVSATITKKAGRNTPISNCPTCHGVGIGAVTAFPMTYEVAVTTMTATLVAMLVEEA